MSEAKHTPGPWALDGPIRIVKYGEEWACIGEVHRLRPLSGDSAEVAEGARMSDPDFKTECANARLIAAAPELLESLKEVVRWSDRKTDIWDKAKAAIAKAEGRA